MGYFSWHDESPPESEKIRQVYGIIFTRDGRVLLRVVNEKDGSRTFSLAGGKPESYDNGVEGTLRREIIEEVNTTIEKPFYVGYQAYNEEGEDPIIQVRMTGLITKIGEKKPDTDGGEIYDRLLTSPERAIELLNWGEVGYKQVMRAKEIAKEKLEIKEFSQKEEYV